MKHTPLTIAAFNGRHEVIEVLLNRNANVNHVYAGAQLAVQPPLPAGTHTLRCLCASSHMWSPFPPPLNPRMVFLLLCPRTSDGQTALMFAAKNGKDTIIRLLLNRGALPNIKVTYGVREGSGRMGGYVITRLENPGQQEPS